MLSAIAAALLVGLVPAARATTVVPPEFTALVNTSDYIVRAVVKSVTAEERAAPSGTKMIYSKVELEVKQVIAGQPPSPLVLDVLGGRLGGRELAIGGAPKFNVGDEAIYFVQGNGRQIYPLTTMMHGLYPIRKEVGSGREYITRSNGVPMRDVREVSRSMDADAGVSAPQKEQLAATALSPANFVLSIRATAKTPKLREH